MNEILIKTVENYGHEKQMDKAIEEMSELIKELCKYKFGEENRSKVIEEIADVELMIEQLKYIFNVGDYELECVKNFKFNRLKAKIDAFIKEKGLKHAD